MMAPNPQIANPMQMITEMLAPWQRSLQDPAATQEEVLQTLLGIYTQTGYGRKRGADAVGSIADYRAHFPIATYDDYQPVIRRMMAGEEGLLVNEPILGWAITRGTTKGENKYIPMTPTDIEMRVSAGRAVMMYAAQTRSPAVFAGVNLNLNFPSVVGTVKAGEREIEYGYSSGIYTRFVSEKTPVRSVPAQAEIDALGGSKSWSAWEARFDLAYEKCREENVTLVGGVAPTAVSFGRYLHKTHHCYPKDLWNVQVMTLGSTAGINTYRAGTLKALYGREVAIREIYGATEGMFGQQMDDKRAWAPNYDLFFFEVETRKGVKMLHEMTPGETGSLVVSTPVLARYKIGDLIRAYTPPYFRCIGRDKWTTPFVHAWRMVKTLDTGRL
ncbi:GH3 auxin-responsive promoter family protein [bacterium]|nr:GH3 auxin-responsive promoter family protein [bacterium]